MAPRSIRPEETAHVDELVARGRSALAAFEGATQEDVDRLCQAVAWSVANEKTFSASPSMGVEESGIGDPVSRVGKRFKVMGILRDVLRQKSVGVIEELPDKGIVKYAKPVGLVASLVPTTNPELTPPGVGLFVIKCRDAVIFSPHPRSKRTTRETVEIMRRALAREGAPEDLLQCLERPSIPAAQYLMTPPISSRRPAVGTWSRRPTARACRRTASAPATRRWSSMRPRMLPKPRATRGSARHRTSVQAVRRTAT